MTKAAERLAIGGFRELVIEALVKHHARSGQDLNQEALDDMLQTLPGAIADVFTPALIAKEKAYMRVVAADVRGFNARNERRWKPAFDALESVWHAALEVGSAVNEHFRPNAVEENNITFEAVTSLHARALLVTRECIALIRTGFADGALARWRTLHEITVLALLLAGADRTVAERYLLTFRFDSLKAAIDINKLIDPGTRDSISDEEVSAMKASCERLSIRFGPGLDREYEWARSLFENTTSPNRRITFRELETLAGETAMRPYYRWASQHNHASYRPADKSLGLKESKQPTLLTGQSNGGMVNPLQLVALSLAKTTRALMIACPSFDGLIYMLVLDALARRVGPLAVRVEQATYRRAMRRTRAQSGE